MPIDYSKWDNLDSSDDDDDDGGGKVKAPGSPPSSFSKKKHEEAVIVDGSRIALSKENAAVAGSSWNHSSWHFEEQKQDKWAVSRLKQLFNDYTDESGSYEIQHEGAELRLASISWSQIDVRGEAWNHIRKGKLVTGYDMNLTLRFGGALQPGGWPCDGILKLELTVDDDEPTADVEFAQRTASMPFASKLKKLVISSAMKRSAKFVSELRQKGKAMSGDRETSEWRPEANVQVGQFQKYEQGPDGTSALAEVAKKQREQLVRRTRRLSTHTRIMRTPQGSKASTTLTTTSVKEYEFR